MKYEKPEIKRFGTLQEMVYANFIQNGGCQEFGDGATPFHRYACTK